MAIPNATSTLAGSAKHGPQLPPTPWGFAGRYGGEEFCLLLPNTESRGVQEIGEIVRAAIQNLAMPHCTSRYQTVSVGVACAKPNDGQRPAT